MEKIFNIALAVHIISILGILGLLLSQVQKSPRKLKTGVIHAGLTAFVAGIVMVSVFTDANPGEELNHFKIGIKSLVLVGILFLGYRDAKKEFIKNWVWGLMLGLTVLNVIIAVGWK
jgi:hypothetical protein